MCLVIFMLHAGAWWAADLMSHFLQGMVSTPPSLRTALLLGAMVVQPPMGLTRTLHRRRAASVVHQPGAPRRGKSWLTVSRLYACCTCMGLLLPGRHLHATCQVIVAASMTGHALLAAACFQPDNRFDQGLPALSAVPLGPWHASLPLK